MQPRRALVAVLLILVIGSAARSRVSMPEVQVDSSAGLGVRTAVPQAVMSTLRHGCFDCHSDETRWPWYAQLPIASHLIEHDVEQGRGQLNWSHWGEYNPFDRADLLDKVCMRASTATMPPWQYRMLHPEARLSAREIDELCAWSEQEASRLIKGGS